jgi:MoaA/NifB/PqqE/SkfB family radical SAM enzyme
MENNIILDVGVSLDGIKEDHDRIRGVDGNFEKADRLLHELVKLREEYRGKLRIAAGIVFSDLTMKSLEAVRSYARELNIDLTEAWYNESSFYDNVGTRVSSDLMVRAVETQPDAPLKELWLKALQGKETSFPCFAIHTFCVLKCNGDIGPCLSHWDASIGNVRDCSPTSVWHSEGARKVRCTVRDCKGCLNTWGAGWSLEASFYHYLLFYMKHPHLLVKKLWKE